MARRESFLQALWLIAVAVNFGLMLFLVRSLQATSFFAQQKTMTFQNEPQLGSEIPEPLRPFLGTDKPLLVVAFGQCSECTLRNLNGWVVMLNRWSDEVKGLIVAQENRKVLSKYANELGWKIPFLADEEGKILEELNAYFLPRIYGFSPEGKLVWKQESIATTQLESIRAVVEAVKGKEYGKKVFERKPKWAEDLGKGENSASLTQNFARGGERR